VGVHARAVVLKIGFGMNVSVLPCAPGHVLDDVLERHQLVGHGEQRVEADADLALAAGGDLVVVQLDVDADLISWRPSPSAGPGSGPSAGHREVALLGAGLVAEVAALVAAGVPRALDRVDEVEATVGAVSKRTSSKMKNSGSGPK
jgi:hypothetical protein